jgi:Na+/phosphate symporter
VKRLLQLGTWLLILAAFLTPVVEFFDQWDPPGPSNDTEMAVFGIIFALSLVLLVCKLLAALATHVSFVISPRLDQDRGSPYKALCSFVGVVLPQLSPPLRI